FEGAIEAKIVPYPNRAFMIEVLFDSHHPRLIEVMERSDKKPPTHFHPYQTEYFEVLEGRIIIEIEGKARIITPADGEVDIKPWVHHRSYPAPVTEQNITKFLMSGSVTKENYPLDTVFFQNWYGYQDQIVLYGEYPDPIQVFSLFDGGGSCLSLPWYVPFGKTISMYFLNIVIGRWIGGLLGYQPFHREWTNDWDTACQRMSNCIFQRRFALN
ncbi:hypothetical protein M501DRAFT_944649, partial [Patellaria atrata CBS 101060]